MKKSELKDYIKEQITNILTEATPEDVQNQADLNKELEKTADLKKSMGMNEDEEEYEGSLKESMPSQEEVTNFLEKFGQELHYLYDKPVSSWDEYDLANWKAKKNKLQEEDIELEIPGEESNAPVGDKKMQAKASRQDAKIQAYKDITAKMKDALEKFKAAEGDAKEAAKEELKALTPEFQAAKKEYEKLKSVKL